MIGSAVSLLRRHVVLLAVVGMAMFLWDQGSRREPPDATTQIHVVTGTVAEFETSHDRFTDSRGRFREAIRFRITTNEHPSNVSFRIDRPPERGIPEGARVRFEVRGDPGPTLAAAAGYPTSRQEIHAVGLAVNGGTVYSAAGDAERAAGAVWRWRTASLVCWTVALGWIALLARRHRARRRIQNAATDDVRRSGQLGPNDGVKGDAWNAAD